MKHFVLDIAAAARAVPAERVSVVGIGHCGRVSHDARYGVLQFELIDTTLQCRDFILCKAVKNLLRLRRNVRIDSRRGLINMRVGVGDCQPVFTTLLPRRLFILRFL